MLSLKILIALLCSCSCDFPGQTWLFFNTVLNTLYGHKVDQICHEVVVAAIWIKTKSTGEVTSPLWTVTLTQQLKLPSTQGTVLLQYGWQKPSASLSCLAYGLCFSAVERACLSAIWMLWSFFYSHLLTACSRWRLHRTSLASGKALWMTAHAARLSSVVCDKYFRTWLSSAWEGIFRWKGQSLKDHILTSWQGDVQCCYSYLEKVIRLLITPSKSNLVTLLITCF